MIAGMIALILTNGLGFFWPGPLVQLTLQDGTVLLGEVTAREAIPQPGTPEHLKNFRIQLKLGNRDLTGTDFRWIDESAITRRDSPADAIYVERREYGPFIGTAVAVVEGDRRIADGSAAVLQALPALVAKAEDDRDAIRTLEADELGTRELPHRAGPPGDPAARARRRTSAGNRYLGGARRPGGARWPPCRSDTSRSNRSWGGWRSKRRGRKVLLRAADGAEKELAAFDIFRAYPANQLTTIQRMRVYSSRLWEFLAAIRASPTPKAASSPLSSAP